MLADCPIGGVHGSVKTDDYPIGGAIKPFWVNPVPHRWGALYIKPYLATIDAYA